MDLETMPALLQIRPNRIHCVANDLRQLDHLPADFNFALSYSGDIQQVI
jgi:hypothetical protein